MTLTSIGKTWYIENKASAQVNYLRYLAPPKIMSSGQYDYDCTILGP